MDLPLLEEHYELADELGRGGFGVVLAGRRKSDGAAAAVKIAHDGISDDLRVMREVERLRAVRHPRLADLHGLFVDAAGRQALVYELVPGQPLDEALAAGVPVAPAPLVRDLGAALDALHQAGLVHRDVKAPNVMVEPGDQFRLVDYGLLRGVDEGDTVTGTGLIVGTVATMPPEQFLGARLGPQADLFSLGCILFLVAEGREPFPEENPSANLAAKKFGPPRVGDRDAFYRKALNPDPEARFTSGGEMASAFARARSGIHVLPRADATQILGADSAEVTAPFSPAPVSAAPPPGKPSPQDTQAVDPLAAPVAPPAWRHPVGLAALGLCVLLGALLPGRGAAPPEPTAPPAPPPSVAPVSVASSPFAFQVRALERWAYPEGMPWIYDLEDGALVPKAVEWPGPEDCGPPSDLLATLASASKTTGPDAAADRAAIALALPRLARVHRQLSVTKKRLKNTLSFDNTIAMLGDKRGGFPLAVQDRNKCLKDLKDSWKETFKGLAENRAEAYQARPPLEVAFEFALASIFESSKILDREAVVRWAAPQVPAPMRRVLFSALLVAEPPTFGALGPTMDDDDHELEQYSCSLPAAWDRTGMPRASDPGDLPGAAAEALELLWRIRLNLLAAPSCLGSRARFQTATADLLERLEELVLSGGLDAATLKILRWLSDTEGELLDGVVRKARPRLVKRLGFLHERIARRAARARAPHPADRAGWEDVLAAMDWDLQGAMLWPVYLEGHALAGDDEVSVHRQGHDVSNSVTMREAFAAFYDEALDEVRVSEDLAKAVIAGSDPLSWPTWARARIRELEARFAAWTGDLAVRPLFPYLYVHPIERVVPRPARLGVLGPAEAEGWLGTFYDAARRAEGVGTGADATREALYALGRAVVVDDFSDDLAAGLAAALIRDLGPIEHPALRDLGMKYLLGMKVDEDSLRWRDLASALEAAGADP